MSLVTRVTSVVIFVCFLGVALGVITHAQNESVYTITVPVDATTAGDLAIIRDFYTFALPDTEVSQSLRRIFMAAVGEMTVATDARIAPDGLTLTLDDGSVVGLQEGDTIAAQPEGYGPLFKCKTPGAGDIGGCKPYAVCHPSGPDGVVECMPVPPKKKARKK
jgi:hypothetical protein